MILITGASGKTGCAVLRHLTDRNVYVRVMIRHAEQRETMLSLGAQDVICGDIQNFDNLLSSMKDINAVYHIPPNMYQEEERLGQDVIKAARESGVRYLVYHSVFHPQIQAMPHHWNKLKVEEAIIKSGLDYSIIQPTAYMQNILAYWQAIIREGVFSSPYSPETRLGLVDLEDVAEAAALVLTDSSFIGGTFELVGTPPLSQIEVARLIGEKLGKPVKAVAQDREAWKFQAKKNGLNEYAIETLIRMFEYYEKHGMWGSTVTLHNILKRSPGSLDQFLTREIMRMAEK